MYNKFATCHDVTNTSHATHLTMQFAPKQRMRTRQNLKSRSNESADAPSEISGRPSTSQNRTPHGKQNPMNPSFQSHRTPGGLIHKSVTASCAANGFQRERQLITKIHCPGNPKHATSHVKRSTPRRNNPTFAAAASAT